MAANLESVINEKLRALPPEKQQQVLEFVEGLANGNQRETISQKLERHLRTVPADELEELPADASENLDHFLYGAPKRRASCSPTRSTSLP